MESLNQSLILPSSDALDEDDQGESFDLTASGVNNRPSFRIMLTVTSDFLDLMEKFLKIVVCFKDITKDASSFILPDAVYTEEEICRFLKVSRLTLRQMIEDGRMNAYPISDKEYRMLGRTVLSYFDGGSPINSSEEAF